MKRSQATHFGRPGIAAATSSGVRWRVLVPMTLAHMWISLGAYSLPPLAAWMQRDLGLSRAQIGALMSAWSLGALLASAPAGWIGRLVEIRAMIVLGQVILGACIAAVALVDAYVPAIAAMLLSGIGYGLVAPATSQMVMDHFSRQARATAMGIKQTGVPLGSFIAAGATPWLAQWAGWRWGLGLSGALAMVTALPMFFLYPRQGRPRAAAEKTLHAAPRLLGRDLVLAYCTGLLLAGAQVATVTYLALFLHEVLRLNRVLAGSYVALMQVSAVFGRPGWGIASDRWLGGNRKLALALAAALAAIGALLTNWLGPASPAWLVGFVSVLFGLCVIGWSGVYLALVAELATANLTATSTGISAVFTYTGVILLPPLFGYLVDQGGTYRWAWLMIAALAVLPVFLLVAIRGPVSWPSRQRA